jgi:hypothetical protein
VAQCVSDLRPRLAAHMALERYVQRVGDSHFSAAPPPPPVTERTEELSAQVAGMPIPQPGPKPYFYLGQDKGPDPNTQSNRHRPTLDEIKGGFDDVLENVCFDKGD